LPDRPEAVVLCHAAWRLGAVVVPGRPSDSRQVLARAVVAAVPRERLGEIAASGDHGFLRAVVTVETEPPRTRRRDARPRTADVPREEPSAGPAGTVAALRPAPHARHIPAQRSGSG
ncbi:hypothetical protein GTW65_18195, partial [Streptomyces sp. SID4956]|nr:hypothetical protein [Streptomyces sp. SID4956]